MQSQDEKESYQRKLGADNVSEICECCTKRTKQTHTKRQHSIKVHREAPEYNSVVLLYVYHRHTNM